MRASYLLLLEVAVLLAAPLPKDGKQLFPPVIQPDTSPAPKPAPVPGAVPVLSGELLYVVPMEEPFLLFASPPGLVTVTKEAGPLRVRGKFLDGSGKVETRNYSAKFLAIVEAVPGAKGRVELVLVPNGITDEKDAARMLVDVNHGAQPPPDVIPDPKPVPPKPTPDPEPKPKPTPVAGPFFFVTVTESAERTIEQAKVINDTAFWKSLKADGSEYRHFDQSDPIAVKQGYTKVFNDLGPCFVIMKMDGTVVRKVKLPASTGDVTALLKEITGK